MTNTSPERHAEPAAAKGPSDWQTNATDIVRTIAMALERGYAPSDILDENSPIRDRIRLALASWAAPTPQADIPEPLSVLAEAAKWLHAAYGRPPQTPETVAMLARVDAALATPVAAAEPSRLRQHLEGEQSC